MAERVSRRIAHAGIASRREAERLIAEGRVAVNGQVLASPAVTVTADDVVTVDDQRLPDRPHLRLWRLNKPPGLVVSRQDERGRRTVFDLFGDPHPHLMSVGRLDIASEGLLLVTNDGDLARWMELPQTGWIRRYRVRVYGALAKDALETLEKGVTVDGVRYGSITARLDGRTGANAWLTMTLREGRNREIRRVLGSLGLAVNRLIRTSYGPFQLGKLARGAVEEVPVKVLREQLPGDWRPRLDAHHRRPS